MVHKIKNGNSFKFLTTMQQILSNKCQKNFDHFELYLHVPTFISKEEKLIETSANFYLNKAIFNLHLHHSRNGLLFNNSDNTLA